MSSMAGISELTGTLRRLSHASKVVSNPRRRARHVGGRFLEAATGHDLEIELDVPGDLRQSPFAAVDVLRARTNRLQLRLCTSASRLYRHQNVLRQVCDDYFRLVDSVPQAGEVVIDAGANIGCYSIVAALLEPAAEIHAFEPLGSAYARLVANCGANHLAGRIVPNQAGLGRERTQLELIQTEHQDQGTLRPDLWPAGSETNHLGGGDVVSVLALDDYLAERHLAGPRIIKIDVEGFEVEVLKGAQHALKNVRLLVLEWHSTGLYEEAGQLAAEAGLVPVSACSDDPDRRVGIAYFRRA